MEQGRISSKAVMATLKRVVVAVAGLAMRLVIWWWRRTSIAWVRAWDEPARELRLLYLGVGLLVSWALIPAAFKDMGFTGGVSYFFALFMAMSNATVFRVVKIGRAEYLPLGAIAPIAILVGVVGSRAIRPLLGDAKNVALTGDLAGAAIILSVFLMLTLLFRKWQTGNPYGDSPVRPKP